MSLSGPWVDLVAIAAGAALLVVATGGAAAAPTAPRAASAPSPVLELPDISVVPAPTGGGAGQALHVSVPELMVGPASRPGHGRVLIPVLVAAPATGGMAHVTASDGDCSARVSPGRVVWLRCRAELGAGATVVVDLDDGRTLSRELP